jgi:hypothetical protein
MQENVVKVVKYQPDEAGVRSFFEETFYWGQTGAELYLTVKKINPNSTLPTATVLFEALKPKFPLIEWSYPLLIRELERGVRLGLFNKKVVRHPHNPHIEVETFVASETDFSDLIPSIPVDGQILDESILDIAERNNLFVPQVSNITLGKFRELLNEPRSVTQLVHVPELYQEGDVVPTGHVAALIESALIILDRAGFVDRLEISDNPPVYIWKNVG